LTALSNRIISHMSDATTSVRPLRSFKGGSTPITSRVQTQVISTPIPYGVVTPLQLPNKTGETLRTTTDIVEGVVDNFKNMLLTNYGERIGKPDFGANLSSLLTERVSQEEWNSQAASLIRKTTQVYMPYITIMSVAAGIISAGNDGFSRTLISVIFSIPAIGVQNKRVDITLTNVS
jgi:phage baseplate assembly protein W